MYFRRTTLTLVFLVIEVHNGKNEKTVLFCFGDRNIKRTFRNMFSFVSSDRY